MAAPFTIYTFTDEDGDEFPIRLAGHIRRVNTLIFAAADAELQRQERAGEIRPNGVLRLSGTEYR